MALSLLGKRKNTSIRGGWKRSGCRGRFVYRVSHARGEALAGLVWVPLRLSGEAAMGDHFGLSGEVGGARIVDPADSGLIVPTFGVGLHYYW